MSTCLQLLCMHYKVYWNSISIVNQKIVQICILLFVGVEYDIMGKAIKPKINENNLDLFQKNRTLTWNKGM